jgi:hypothetical protein
MPLSPDSKDLPNIGLNVDQQSGIARMLLMAQHQQRIAIQSFLAQHQQQATLNPIQLQMLLQQYRQPTYNCSICSMNFDNQAMYIIHCSRAHSNSEQVVRPEPIMGVLQPKDGAPLR